MPRTLVFQSFLVVRVLRDIVYKPNVAKQAPTGSSAHNGIEA